jgi:trimethylamine:corrinoid methyltransferase-like protein
MGTDAFVIRNPRPLGRRQLDDIETAALRILEEVGIAVHDDDARRRLCAAGFRARGDRVFIEADVTTAFLDEERGRDGEASPPDPISEDGVERPIQLSVSPYPQHVHEIETDGIVPFDTPRLIEATKLVDGLAAMGVVSSPPGCPADVPPALQPVVQYWVAATYSRQGRRPVDAKSRESLPYVMDIAEALGHPLRSYPVYVFSPLTLAGESLRCVVEFADRFTSVSVSNMSSLGCSAPVGVGNACALSVAEVAGAAILVRELTGLPVRWSIRICPVDLSSLAMSLGTAEDLLLHLVNTQVNAHFHGRAFAPTITTMHTSAKAPGPQACAEKASLMTAGALLGARHFGDAGTISLDEVFSPEQLLYDIEIKDHVTRIARGFDIECSPEACLAEIAAGVEEGGFVGLETTVDQHRDVYWRPRLFERRFLSSWQAEGEASIRERAHELIADVRAAHEYALCADTQSDIDDILAAARADL